ncbi:GGDEF domain-containing protein [Coprococcus comes]|uniref:GGDEF domain-containing protein n=1 Tax=Coprococcus comes TaxID=410072 RepID=UPI00189B578C|nr:GGDEF domain-containing protein [Coprococcus comes]
MQTSKKNKNIIGIIQSFLILILVVLIIFMMIHISRLQGTARVINYAGLVRGATQREVKLEITGNQNDELIKYLDDILLGLRYQDGHYNLVKLNDEEYQGKLKIQSDYWDKLKTEIEAVRNKGYENTDIVNMSEIYFTMADETVSAAESYSEKIAIKIRTIIELLSALDMLILVILVIMQTLKAMQMAMQNRLLEQKAFVDAHTGLPNKNACNELLNKKDIITGSTACIMFDLNNLKTINDTMGHSAGDQLILNFSKFLRSVIPEKDFVGRYGGDEFIAVIYHTNEAEIKEILKGLYREKDRLNSYENQIPIDYACGWALSSDNMSCTMQMLLDDADANMYKNKQLCKKYN